MKQIGFFFSLSFDILGQVLIGLWNFDAFFAPI